MAIFAKVTIWFIAFKHLLRLCYACWNLQILISNRFADVIDIEELLYIQLSIQHILVVDVYQICSCNIDTTIGEHILLVGNILCIYFKMA